MFDARGNLNELLAEIATAFVVLGLVFEYVLPVFDHFKKPWYERPRAFKSLFHIAGPILVIGGIVGELTFHHASNKLQNETIIELQKRIAQRELTADQIKRLRSALAATPASVPHNVVFVYLMGDQESAYFTYEIGRYFFVPNWHIDLEVRSYPVILAWGIKIWGPDNPTTRAVKAAFTAAKIPFATDGLPEGGFQSFGHAPMPGDTDIFIGPKEPAITADEAARAGIK